ncbi:MAG: cysteine methyltransferase [Bradyrhizobiaceae bacterium PARB1]|jgi:methylated-DNA-[protein]-cysteine S-methyltransferase|nr:MAG: cysteine methyltransferase [Bradyrhizobiaceae bacterium PARB1]
MADIHFALFDTAIGRCGIAWAAGGIVGVQLPLPSEAQTRGRLKQRYQALSEAIPPAGVQIAIDRMIALMDGKPIDFADIDLDLSESPDFNREVYAIAREIPPGKTMTYGDIAKRLGGVELSRNVGQAMGQNPCPIIVPCHRVLAAGGKPGGFSANGGVETKLKMLAIEGAYVNHTPSLFD